MLLAIKILLALFFGGNVWAANAPLNIKTEDGTVSTYPYQLKVTNGSLTNNGDGTATLNTSGGGGSGTPGGSQGDIQFLDVQGTVTNFGGNSGFYYSGTGSTAGNVGIGSPTPTQALDVAGTIKMTDFIAKGPVADIRAFGAVAGSDDTTAINACFSSSAQTCEVPASSSNWITASTITIPGTAFTHGTQGKTLQIDPGAVITPNGDFNVFNTEEGAHITGGGTIRTSGVSGYNHAMIYRDGRNFLDSGGVSNLILDNGNGTSTSSLGYGIENDAGFFNSGGGSYAVFFQQDHHIVCTGLKHCIYERAPHYEFTISSATAPTLNAVFSNNGHSYTITEVNLVAGAGTIDAYSTGGAPSASGTLVYVSGPGSHTSISFTSSATFNGAVNGNNEDDIIVWGGYIPIFIDGPSTNSTLATAQGNKIKNVHIEDTDPTYLYAGLYVNGQYNNVELYPWDIGSFGSNSGLISIATSTTLLNTLDVQGDQDKFQNGFADIEDDTISGNTGPLNNYPGIVQPHFKSIITDYSTGGAAMVLAGYSANGWVIGQDPVSPGAANQDYSFYDYNTGTTPLIVKFADGNVGIGSVNPSGSLDVGGGSICLGHVCDSSWPSGGSSQWSGTSGSNLSYSLGNVGIGTSTVTAPLLVAANNAGNAVIVSQANSSGTGIYVAPGADANAALTIANAAESQNQDLFYGNGNSNLAAFSGNVGIGSALPGQKLDVNGTARMTGLIVTGTGTGNVGINSATPGQTLDVAGTARATVFLGGNIGIGTTLTTTSALTVMNGNVGIGTWVPSEELAISAGNIALDPGQSIKWGTVTSVSGTPAGTGYSEVIYQPIATNTTQLFRALPKGTPANGAAFGVGNVKTGFELFGSDLGADPNNYDRFMVFNGSTAIGLEQGVKGTGTPKPIFFGKYNETSAVTTEFARFDTGGNLGIGTTLPAAAFVVGSGGHIRSDGISPTVASNDCGSSTQGTVNANSSDVSGSFVVGTTVVTSCAITFHSSFGVAPICITQDDTNILGIKTSTTTTKMTTTASTSMSGDTITYVCIE